MTEVSQKLQDLRALMSSQDIPALRLKGVDWFSWATGGGSSAVILTSETGVAEVFVTLEQAWILTNVIEKERLAKEEAPAEYKILAFPWQQSSAKEDFVTETLQGRICYSDRPEENEKPLPLEFQYLKMILSPPEIERYRRLGRLASEAMTEAMLKAEPLWTEKDLAGEGAKSLWKRGLDPTLILVGGERRMKLYRHPTPRNEGLGGCAMMVFCARAFGLYANLTRFIFFRKPTSEERDNFKKVAQIEAAAFKNSVAHRPLSSLYQALSEAYQQVGVGDEINQHHQGGPTGYLSREWVASPSSPASLQIKSGMALAWNPSVRGAKIEDTVLLTDQGLQVLTLDPQWPTFQHEGAVRPDLWIKT